MPLLILPFLGVVATYFLTTKANGDSILAPADSQTTSPIPSWVIPTVLVGIGGFLLYKEGAKLLKL